MGGGISLNARFQFCHALGHRRGGRVMLDLQGRRFVCIGGRCLLRFAVQLLPFGKCCLQFSGISDNHNFLFHDLLPLNQYFN